MEPLHQFACIRQLMWPRTPGLRKVTLILTLRLTLAHSDTHSPGQCIIGWCSNPLDSDAPWCWLNGLPLLQVVQRNRLTEISPASHVFVYRVLLLASTSIMFEWVLVAVYVLCLYISIVAAEGRRPFRICGSCRRFFINQLLWNWTGRKNMGTSPVQCLT